MSDNTYTSPFAGLDTALIGRQSGQPPQGQKETQDTSKSQESLPRPAKIQEKTVPQKMNVGKRALNWQDTRPFKKITCDIFLDQYEALDVYILRYRLETKTKLEMITLIREAIDEYIEKHHLK